MRADILLEMQSVYLENILALTAFVFANSTLTEMEKSHDIMRGVLKDINTLCCLCDFLS